MCGRYTLRSPAADVARAFQVDATPSLFPRYNIAPTQSVPIVRQVAAREMVLVRWGLVPSWASDLSIGYKLINARSETAASKPSFRSAFKQRRCLVVADGLYEWQKQGNPINSPSAPHRSNRTKAPARSPLFVICQPSQPGAT